MYEGKYEYLQYFQQLIILFTFYLKPSKEDQTLQGPSGSWSSCSKSCNGGETSSSELLRNLSIKLCEITQIGQITGQVAFSLELSSIYYYITYLLLYYYMI